jgi:hypothetical protein
MGLGFEKVHSIGKLMQDNKDLRVFAGWGKP